MKLEDLTKTPVLQCQIQTADVLEEKNLRDTLTNLVIHLNTLTSSIDTHGVSCLVKAAANEANIEDIDAISFFNDLLLSPHAKPIWGNNTVQTILKDASTPAPTNPRSGRISFRSTDPLKGQVQKFTNMINIGFKLVEILKRKELKKVVDELNEAMLEILIFAEGTTIQKYIESQVEKIADNIGPLVRDANSEIPIMELSREEQWSFAIRSILTDTLKMLKEGKEFKGYLIPSKNNQKKDGEDEEDFNKDGYIQLRSSDKTDGEGKGIENVFKQVDIKPGDFDFEAISQSEDQKWSIEVGVCRKYEDISIIAITQNDKTKHYKFPHLTYQCALEQKDAINKKIK